MIINIAGFKTFMSETQCPASKTESLSSGADPRYMLHVKKVVENIWTQHNYIDSNIVQYHSTRCVIVLVVLQSTVRQFFSRWHIYSRVIPGFQSWHVHFGLTMVTSISGAQLLTSACFTCHKLICHLWPLAEIQVRGSWAQSEIPHNHATLSALHDMFSDWKQEWKTQYLAELQSARISNHLWIDKHLCLLGWRKKKMLSYLICLIELKSTLIRLCFVYS